MICKIYTDGSCDQGSISASTKQGGWAFIIIDDKLKIIEKHSGVQKNTTNNQCEMIAVIQAIEKFQELNISSKAEIYCDSAYVVNAFNDGWIEKWMSNGWKNSKNEDVLNKEYWLKLSSVVSKNKISFQKVKRKSNIFSKMVDNMARDEMKSL